MQKRNRETVKEAETVNREMQISVREAKQQNPATIADCPGHIVGEETVLHMECNARHVKSSTTLQPFAEQT